MLSWQVEKTSAKISSDVSHQRFRISNQPKISHNTSAGMATLTFLEIHFSREFRQAGENFHDKIQDFLGRDVLTVKYTRGCLSPKMLR